jgi:glucose/arabinose dehydrogenase
LQGKQAWGRPVDVIIGADGWLYISDDLNGWIYRVRSE